MRRDMLWVVVVGILMAGLAFGPDLWAAPGQNLGRQTVPTRTPVPPPPTEPPPDQPTPEPPPDQPTPGQLTPTPTTTLSLAQLEESLAVAWASEDWQQAIALISQILAIDPNYESMAERLYTAYVNYGYQLLIEEDNDGAIAQFNRALEIRPGGEEALAGIQQAIGATESVFPETTIVGGQSEPLLPAAGGRSVRLHLGAAMIVASLLVLTVVRK